MLGNEPAPKLPADHLRVDQRSGGPDSQLRSDDAIHLLIEERIDALPDGVGVIPIHDFARAVGKRNLGRETRDDGADLAVIEDSAMGLVAQQAIAPVGVKAGHGRAATPAAAPSSRAISFHVSHSSLVM